MKSCSKCKIEYPPTLEYFHRQLGRKLDLTSQCKKCRNESTKKYKKENKDKVRKNKRKYHKENKDKIRKKEKEYYKENKERISKYQKEYYEENKEEIKVKNKQWREKNREYLKECHKEYKEKNPNFYKEYDKKYQKNNRKKLNEYKKERRKIDPQIRLHEAFSTAIYKALKKQGSSKNGYSWETIVNYTIQNLIEHLEQQFTERMTWDNYGKWHVDHIIPQSFFNFTSYEDDEFQKCWNLNNLQPLWAQDNLRKSNKLTI